MSKKIRYTIVSDDDGHKYCVPALKSDEWYALTEQFYAAMSRRDYDNAPDYPPSWAERIDGGFTFSAPGYHDE